MSDKQQAVNSALNTLLVCKACKKKPEYGWRTDGEGFGDFVIECPNKNCQEETVVSDINLFTAVDIWNSIQAN